VPTTSFQVFNYDNYAGSLRIIPRAVRLLDYTPGSGAAGDQGAADTIHGESGDDFVHGETGNDVIFGEGQDDQLLGGAGNDRIYGGTGEDSILGDDGRFVISRNGLTEPLYGVTTVNAQADITLPGPFTGAWIYITGRINSEAHLLSPTKGGNDVIFGGTGDDWIHGGTGDDAISGAEAQAAWYNETLVGAAFYTNGGYTVTDPSNPLGYDATTRKLAAYDANNPLAKISNFFLNFDAADAPLTLPSPPSDGGEGQKRGNKIDDGKDRLFGDDGNDWLVGGTDNDRQFGGKGDDVLNADDNLDTNGGLNNRPDSPTYADRDFVYGGDGLDVMIANTGGDRMFDWGGEFNTYLVPFSAFGEPTIYRTPNPHIRNFLLALGQESGADQTMTEPDGELGLFGQSDPQWQTNHGPPRDPQPGNTAGTPRDTRGGPEDDRGTALPLSGGGVPATLSPLVVNSTDVTLDRVFVTSDPGSPDHQALFVGGSNGNDTIEVRRGSSASRIQVVINGVSRGEFDRANISRVIVYGNDGNDTITVSTDMDPINTVLSGDAGDDVLRGGGGNNFLDGGDGNDKLYGGAGRDMLVGGWGQDTLEGAGDDDVLIGGRYTYSEDLGAIDSLMAAWAGQGTYAERVSQLRYGGSEGLFPLDASTVLDDGLVDNLFGEQGRDWFWAMGADQTDKKGNETVE
jgi:Ca2+-binding RTX toxin-like protein